MSRLADALDRIRFARAYTEQLLESIPSANWFHMPAEGVTHVAWQVGHLAIAQYRLCLAQLRCPIPDDETFFPLGFLDPFKRGSTPNPDPNAYPSAGVIRIVFNAVHEHVLQELAA